MIGYAEGTASRTLPTREKLSYGNAGRNVPHAPCRKDLEKYKNHHHVWYGRPASTSTKAKGAMNGDEI
jgi:hypothetical protein